MSRAYGAVVWIILFAGATHAQVQRARMLPPGVIGAGGMVNFPFTVQDSRGGQWRIQQGGWVQMQQGNQFVYSQGMQLIVSVGGQGLNGQNHQARVDEKSGELVLENVMAGQGLTLTRRILIDKEQGLARYIDILKNTANQPVTASITLQSHSGNSFANSQAIPNPRRPDQQIGWVGQMHGGGTLMEIYNGRGAKQGFTINAQPNSNMLQANMTATIPAGQETAVLHFHGSSMSVDAATKFVGEMRESKLMQTIPPSVRRSIVNFTSGQNYIGDVEILRGEQLDVVEIRGGDQYKGTLKEPSFSLQSVYGKFDVPTDQVIGVVNIGRFRPHYLVVTADGQIFGGKPGKDSLDVELSSKQVVKVPVSQITRIGYRKREGEPEEWTFEKPMVLMRTGERVAVRMPTEPVTVYTRYGKLELKPESIAALVLQAKDHGLHEVRLTDGSEFAGLIDVAKFAMKLDGASAQDVSFPANGIARIRFTNKLTDLSDSTATLSLANSDVLIGTLAGKVSIETAFDTISVNAEEIQSLTHPIGGLPDVSVTLWDGSALSGQLQDQELTCNLANGSTLKVPVMLVEEYQQPQPAPSPAMMERVKSIVAELNAEDWKQRDRAEVTLKDMGPVVLGVLDKLRAGQPAEAQQRIDSIVKELDEKRKSAGGSTTRPTRVDDSLEVPLEIDFEK